MRELSEDLNVLYFDHNATTFLAPEVTDTMTVALREVFGNASSTHRQGQLARQHLEQSRRTIARFLNASPAEFIFTSGGTESNNLAILGLVRNLPGPYKHVITTAIEHPSVLECYRQLEREGVEVTYVGVDSRGIVDAREVERNLRPNTVLVSVMHANNEVGTIQSIKEIAGLIRHRNVFLHCDGVQAFGKIGVDVQELDVDLYSISAHKIFGPKGIGGLYVRKGTPLRGIQHGGRHERERRAGTENVPAAMGFARAVELCEPSIADALADLRDRFEAEVLYRGGVVINGATPGRLPNTSNLLFCGLSAEALVIALDRKGIAVSTGSACSSGSVEPSHVLLAMGRSRDEARSSVRFSFGRYNTAEDVRVLIEAVTAFLSRLRANVRLERSLVV
ncbi:MAG: cysteine desulfurase [Acidobacteriaceae bacterium]|nr:cysteine desulfurase [Acidobacteriaceae bacterium]